jgi:hypothetical protein
MNDYASRAIGVMAKKRVKRPRMPVQFAELIGSIATWRMQDAVEDGRDPTAVASGRKVGLKGGKARAKSPSKTPRSELAKRAAKQRWG